MLVRESFLEINQILRNACQGTLFLGFKAAYEKFVKIGIMEAFFQVDNLLDTEYESIGRFVGLPTPFFIPAPGISVFGGIGFRL